jgi:phage shock protein A
MGDIGMAMQRAQDKTEQMQARAGALDELLASGALQDATVPTGRDDVQSQLDALTAGHDVDDELTRMKAQLPASAARRQWSGPGRHQPIRRHHRQSSRPPRERGP